MKTIRNPLTIIGIFASIAEISASAVLPYISENNQDYFIWFLICFPLLLLILFFLTLNFNHKVLYAPSDYINEDNFMKSFKPASNDETFQKIKTEIQEINNEDKSEDIKSSTSQHSKDGVFTANLTSINSKFMLAEELVLNKISKIYGSPIHRKMRLQTNNYTLVFDGVLFIENKYIVIEVKYIGDNFKRLRFKNRINQAIDQARKIYENLPKPVQEKFTFILAIVTDSPDSEYDGQKNSCRDVIGKMPFNFEIKIYNLKELENEFLQIKKD